MKLYLIRHGETDWNLRNMFYGWTDCDINEKGIKQAHKLKIFLIQLLMIKYILAICAAQPILLKL